MPDSVIFYSNLCWNEDSGDFSVRWAVRRLHGKKTERLVG